MIITDETLQQLDALHDMQELGGINMFGAAVPLSEMFGIDKSEARKVLSFYMTNYQEDRDYSAYLGQTF
jgi:hypothetical protein